MGPTNCHNGSSKLQSGSRRSLNVAAGLLHTGQGELVLALDRTNINRVCNRSDPNFVSPISPCNRAVSASCRNLERNLSQSLDFRNISGPDAIKKSRISSIYFPNPTKPPLLPPTPLPPPYSHKSATPH